MIMNASYAVTCSGEVSPKKYRFSVHHVKGWVDEKCAGVIGITRYRIYAMFVTQTVSTCSWCTTNNCWITK